MAYNTFTEQNRKNKRLIKIDPKEKKIVRAVVQRVTEADVSVDGEITGQIKGGLVVLLGVEEGDSQTDVDYLAEKITGLRIFEDDEGKMNRSLLDTGGSILAVSQFTLLGDVRKGKRPSFSKAAPPKRQISFIAVL